MTLSILMHVGDLIGCAAATGNLAVGAWVLRAEADVGAVATQGLSVSTLWGDEAMAALRKGEAPPAILERLVEADPGSAYRQLAILDRAGRGAGFTGDANERERGQIRGDGYVISGNWLSSLAVLEAMEEAYRLARGEPELAAGEVLLRVLEAGVSAGSDSRGTQSAALKIVAPDRPPLDLRVDYDASPLERLRNLHTMATTQPYSDWVTRVPTKEEPYRF